MLVREAKMVVIIGFAFALVVPLAGCGSKSTPPQSSASIAPTSGSAMPAADSAESKSATPAENPGPSIADSEPNVLSLNTVFSVESPQVADLVRESGLPSDAEWQGNWLDLEKKAAIRRAPQFSSADFEYSTFSLSFKSIMGGKLLTAASLNDGEPVKVANYGFNMPATSKTSHKDYAELIMKVFGVSSPLATDQQNGAYALGKCAIGGRKHYWAVYTYDSSTSGYEVANFVCVEAESLAQYAQVEDSDEAIVGYWKTLDSGLEKGALGYYTNLTK